MVANLTVGRKRYADVQNRILDIRGRADELRFRARRLIDQDSEAYGAVSDAMAMPKDTDAAKAERAARVQSELKSAAVPPLQTMQVACDVIRLAGELVRIGNRSAVSDVGTAASAALAGFEAARLNVEINVASVRDAEWVAATKVELAGIQRPEGAVSEVLNLAELIIRGAA
jgi:formiminotetrahydrofolate cyclodeaminase